jgi:plastocyanin
MMRALFLLAFMLFASPASAGELVFQLKDAKGAPVRDAVVSLYPQGKPVPVSAPARAFQIAQRNIQFNPFVLTVPVGAQVTFPNFDNVRHHVYSFSPAKKFELKLYAKEQNRAVRFDKPGVVPLGCNIHDQMTAFIKVVDTALAAQTDQAGRAIFSAVPNGLVVARVWHPYLRAPGNQIELRVASVAGRQVQPVGLSLRPPPPASANAY